MTRYTREKMIHNHYMCSRNTYVACSDETIIADVAESLAETHPISINRIQNFESINRYNIRTYARSLEETRNELICREYAIERRRGLGMSIPGLQIKVRSMEVL